MRFILSLLLVTLSVTVHAAVSDTYYVPNLAVYTNLTGDTLVMTNTGRFARLGAGVAPDGTSPFIVSAGARANPAIVFSGASTMGFWNDANTSIRISGSGVDWVQFLSQGIDLGTAGRLAWAADTIILRDAANTLAQRNGTAAQTFRLYNTYTDASNYERGFFGWASNNLELRTQNAGTGSARHLRIGSANNLYLNSGGNDQWVISGSTGALLAINDNANDIGASGVNRPRFVHVARTTVSGTTTPAQITGDQNNYNPGGQGKFLRWSTDASRNITGLTFTTAQVDGEEHIIVNVGGQPIVIVNESASSTAANRFHNTTGADITLSADQEAYCWYDGTTARWRVSKRN